MSQFDELKIKKGSSNSRDAVVAVRELYDAIYDPNAALAIFYCSSEYDLEVLGRELRERFGRFPLIGCTTAGEITPTGYQSGSLTGVSIGGAGFVALSARVDTLSRFEFAEGDAMTVALFSRLRQMGLKPSGKNTFGFLLVDGLSMQEEALVSSIYRNLRDIELFGGSAGDGTRFHTTHIYHEGQFWANSAVFTLVHTNAPFSVFKTEGFVPSTAKMVVTGADPGRRLVTEINGEPAGPEYARMVGLEFEQLNAPSFARHPVVVKVGGQTYVRSIQKVNPDRSLTFYCAIEEGIVLTVSQAINVVESLQNTFDRLRQQVGPPSLVLGCDCVLRLLEATRCGVTDQVGAIMAANNVIGFSTYGEQFNAMHMNQTFTGVAIGGRNGHG